MKIKKIIDAGVLETLIAIKTWSDEEFKRVSKPFTNQVFLETVEGIQQVNLFDIVYIEASRNYQEVHTIGELLYVRSPLYQLQHLLGDDFIRSSRSFVFNFNLLTSIESNAVEGMFANVSGVKVPISRAYVRSIRERIDRESRERNRE